jgi:hypothetical protein
MKPEEKYFVYPNVLPSRKQSLLNYVVHDGVQFILEEESPTRYGVVDAVRASGLHLYHTDPSMDFLFCAMAIRS